MRLAVTHRRQQLREAGIKRTRDFWGGLGTGMNPLSSHIYGAYSLGIDSSGRRRRRRRCRVGDPECLWTKTSQNAAQSLRLAKWSVFVHRQTTTTPSTANPPRPLQDTICSSGDYTNGIFIALNSIWPLLTNHPQNTMPYWLSLRCVVRGKRDGRRDC